MLKIPLAAALAAPFTLEIAVAQPADIADEGEYISVSGVVARAEDDSFWLDYGGGAIEVEFEEDLLTDLDLEDRLDPGERVVIYGEIDDEWFSEKAIEADAVYVPGRATWYDRDISPVVTSYYYYFIPPGDVTPAKGVASAEVSFTGEVKSIDDRMFTLDAGVSDLTVDTRRMSENPLDEEGYPKIEEGDRVMVSGQIDENLFAERVLRADEVLSVDAGASAMQISAAGAPAGTQPKEGYYGSDGASSSRTNSAERMVENKTASRDRATGPDVIDGTEGDMANNPVFLAMDDNENGEISEREYVKFVQRPANISKDEARMFFEAVADGDDAITPKELFSTSGLERMSEKVTDRNRR